MSTPPRSPVNGVSKSLFARKDFARGCSVDSRSVLTAVMESETEWRSRGRRCSSVADLEKHAATVAVVTAGSDLSMVRRCHSAQSERTFEAARETVPEHPPEQAKPGRRSSFFHRAEKAVSPVRRGSMPVSSFMLDYSPEHSPAKEKAPKKGKFGKERCSLLNMKRNSLPAEPDGADQPRRRFSSSGGAGRLESVTEGLMSALAPGVAYIASGPPSRPTSPCAPKLRTPVWLLAMSFAELSGKFCGHKHLIPFYKRLNSKVRDKLFQTFCANGNLNIGFLVKVFELKRVNRVSCFQTSPYSL